MPQSVNFLNCWHLDIKVNPFALSCSSSSEDLHKFGLITKGTNNVPHAFIANIDAVVQNLCCNQHIFVISFFSRERFSSLISLIF